MMYIWYVNSNASVVFVLHNELRVAATGIPRAKSHVDDLLSCLYCVVEERCLMYVCLVMSGCTASCQNVTIVN